MLIHFREIISGDLKNVTIGSTFVVFSNKSLASPPKDSKEPRREVNSNFPLAMTCDKVESLNIYNPLFYTAIALPKDAFQS